MRRWLGPALVALLALHALVATPAWSDLRAALATRSYRGARSAEAFGHLDTDRFVASVDAWLGPGEPVRVATGDAATNQRLTELLYPRPVDAGATHAIVLGSGGGLALVGPPDAPHGEAAPDAPEPLDAPPLRLLLALIGWLGWGAAAWAIARRARPGALPATAIPLAGAIVIALLVEMASISGVPLALGALVGGGLAMGAVAAAMAWRGDGVRAPSLGIAVPIAIAALLALVVAHHPITGWDGRSIWLFHAKEIWHRGRFAAVDAGRPETIWSHSDYPPLFPALMAFFSGASGRWNEHLASFAIPALALATMLPLWDVARARVGDAGAAALVAAIALSCASLFAGGYADGYLALAIALQLAAGLERPWLFGLAAAAASMVKLEGLPLAAIVAAGAALANPPLRARAARALVALVPAIGWRAWSAAVGAESVLHGRALPVASIASRLATIAVELPPMLAQPGELRCHALMWEGAAAAIVALALAPRSRAVRAALATAAAALLFAIAAIALLPDDAAWLVRFSLDRLLLHPAALALIAALIALREHESGALARPAPPPQK